MFSANSSQVSEDRLYVEDVFSTWLYTGNSSTQTITNGIDLAGKGGLVWMKSRSTSGNNILEDSGQGFGVKYLYTNSTDAAIGDGNFIISGTSGTGFTLGNSGANSSGTTYASWTFRKAPKFFDVVTYTGNGANRNIAHSLGVAPGCIIVKRTDAAADWQVYHRSNANTEYMVLNTTAAKATGTTRWNSTTPTATEFTVGTDTTVNANGGTYVAYLFAHDTTSDGIIQCGSYTGNGSTNGPTVNLGWEPQWLLFKRANSASGWYIIDNMRGMALTGNGNSLYPNLTDGENVFWAANFATINPTGFQIVDTDSDINSSGSTYLYMAIRRGPMRTPTSGTSVFSPVSATPTGSDPYITAMTTNFPVDLTIDMNRQNGGTSRVGDRLRGGTKFLATTSTGAEDTYTTTTWPGFTSFDSNTSITQRVWSGGFGPIIGWNFRRAPSFFDVVCYTGTGSTRTVAHNLGVAPELMIVKRRSAVGGWSVFLNMTSSNYARGQLNGTDTPSVINYSDGYGLSAQPTSTLINLDSGGAGNDSGTTYVAYLFASCPGVSKVGSYTGNGSSQTINCGFAAGARFVMIKRTDSTGDWYVWDSARGIVAGNDPHLSLNSTAAEVTTDDSVDTDSSGFVVNQLSATNINVNAATYLYMAVA